MNAVVTGADIELSKDPDAPLRRAEPFTLVRGWTIPIPLKKDMAVPLEDLPVSRWMKIDPLGVQVSVRFHGHRSERIVQHPKADRDPWLRLPRPRVRAADFRLSFCQRK